jgi:hypothetical protein
MSITSTNKEKIIAKKVSTEAKIRNIQRKTRHQYTAEEKFRVVLKSLRAT